MSSTNVAQIIASTKTVIASVLAAYSQLPHGYNISDNDKASLTTGYQVIPLDTVSADGVTRNYTVNQGYEVSISNAYTEPDANDESKRNISIALMDLAHDVYNKLIGGRCGIPAIVQMVSGISIDEPVFFPDKEIAVIKLRYLVQFTEKINF